MAAAGVYFDTSVVVKRYVRESETELARSLRKSALSFQIK
jgi:predicted nucleic acid-binding protein